MMEKAKFIWLDEERYPTLQKSSISIFSTDKKKYRFGVAAFKKEFCFNKKIETAEIEVFGDTRFYLWQNGKFIGTGPCSPCGDVSMPYQYSNKFNVEIGDEKLNFYARVQLTPTVERDNSKGKGCFIMEARLVFEDGSTEIIYTDETWNARQEKEFLSPFYMDYTKKRDEWGNAVITENIWNVEKSQIKELKEQIIDSKQFTVPPETKMEFFVELDKIYSAYSMLNIRSAGDYEIELITAEFDNASVRKHWIRGNKNEIYRSNEYYSVGEYKLVVDNKSDNDMEIVSDVIFACYPSEEKGLFKCSDEMLNRIWELGKWTVKICRQSLELDSPVHQENLFCTGDYIIESLVNNYTTGDYSLTRFDILRMGRYLKITEGYMYLGNYALLWAEWLYGYYLYSGDTKIFDETIGGLEAVLERYKKCEKDNGLLENINGFAFIDWAFIDGYSMFAPPRALGETVVNLFYYNLLDKASKIYAVMGEPIKERYYSDKAEKFKLLINATFFDADKGLYFDGLNESSPCGEWEAENPSERYYTRYSNILATLFGVCEKERAKSILKWVLEDENLDGIQPYFMHYLIESVYKNGLFDKSGLKLIKKWRVLVEKCEKGMHEVWHEFEGYKTDYSHGWGSTPTYQLPSKILGIEILEAGFKKIHLNPKLYGLDWVELKVPTPYGDIVCNMAKDKDMEIYIPDGIEAEIY